MKDVFQKATIDEFIARINKLQPHSERKWGKMSVGQMIAHCSEATKVALGEKELKRRFIGRLFGKMIIKKITKDAKPFRHNGPTDPDFVISDDRDFDEEKAKLVSLLKKFAKKSASEFENRVHPFFGKMTPTEWSILTYKHFDHHLRQFGV